MRIGFALVLVGCSVQAAPVVPLATSDAAPASVDAAVDAVVDAATVGFLTEEPSVVDGGDVIVDRVTYASGSLVVHGRVCRPAGEGAHPLVMLDHGGFEGIDLDATSVAACTGLAELGIVAAMSSYRGEDGSDGSVEVCLGEVDDVLAMKAILVAEPWVAGDRVATVGFSHGACIATRSALRDPSFRALVDFFGPADVGAAYAFWQAQLGNGEAFCAATGQSTSTCASMHQYLVSHVTSALGGAPSEVPGAYAARSPAPSLAKLAAPAMIFQGTSDYAIDLDQACTKRALLTPRAWYLDASLHVASSSACGGGFETSALPTSFPDAAYLFVYEGEGHGFGDAAENSAGSLAMPFLLQELE